MHICRERDEHYVCLNIYIYLIVYSGVFSALSINIIYLLIFSCQYIDVPNIYNIL